MGSFSIWHWLIVLAVVVVIFGTKKLRNVGGDLGAAVKGFKDGMKGAQDVAETDAAGQPQQQVGEESRFDIALSHKDIAHLLRVDDEAVHFFAFLGGAFHYFHAVECF